MITGVYKFLRRSVMAVRGAWLLPALVMLLSAAPLQAATMVWSNAAGGDFSTPGNWTNNLVPGVNDIAVFNYTNNPYTVTWSANVTNDSFQVQRGTVKFDLQGHTYNYNQGPNSGNSSLVGQTDKADLTVTNGSLQDGGNILMLFIGANGYNVPGSVLRVQGAYVHARYFEVNKSSVAPGTSLLVDGTNSSISSGGYNDIGNGSAPGYLVVTNGGTASLSSINVNYGGVTVDGTNSLCTVQNGGIMYGGLMYLHGGTFKNLGGSAAVRYFTINSGAVVTLSTGTFALASSGNELYFHGVVQGSGWITGYFQNGGGTVLPGGSNGVGTLSFNGQFYNGNTNGTSPGTIEIDLSGTSSNQIDLVSVNGLLTAKGTLTVRLINGFKPKDKDTFKILNFTSITGQFDTVNMPNADPHWLTQNLYTTGEIQFRWPQGTISMFR